jgi:2-polyprenyl-6-methoxyphenol hydroxylase-like FAD-dependent oxidoreductase
MLLKALPHGIMHCGAMVTSVEQAEGSTRVRVKAERKARQQGGSAGAEGDQKEHSSAEADLVIAADGSMSNTRQKFVPDVSRRRACFKPLSAPILSFPQTQLHCWLDCPS